MSVALIVGLGWIPLFVAIWVGYPGANSGAAYIICMLFSLPVGLYYAYAGGIMPRAGGGGYVPVSRAVHPIIGLASSFVLVEALILNAGFAADYTVTAGVSASLSGYASVTHNSSLLNIATTMATPTWIFIIGLIILLLVTAQVVLGGRISRRINAACFFIGLAALVIIIAVLATTNPTSFAAKLNSFAGANAYQNIISTATSQGWKIPSNWLTPTLLAIPFVFFTFTVGWGASYVSGEIRKAGPSLIKGIIAGFILIGVIDGLIGFLMETNFGYNFISSASYLFSSAPSSYPLTVAPYVSGLVSIVNSNIILNIILIAGYIAWAYVLIVFFFMIVSRHFLAWSFDRSVPAALGSVNDRLHSPITGTLVTLVLAIIALIGYTYLPTYLGPVNLTYVYLVGFLFDGLAGIAIPWRLKATFDSSPGMLKRKLGPIPVIAILGAYTFVFLATLLIVSLANPAIAGSFGLVTGGSIIGAFLLGCVSYLAMKQWNLRRGIDISFAFKQVPPE